MNDNRLVGRGWGAQTWLKWTIRLVYAQFIDTSELSKLVKMIANHTNLWSWHKMLYDGLVKELVCECVDLCVCACVYEGVRSTVTWIERKSVSPSLLFDNSNVWHHHGYHTGCCRLQLFIVAVISSNSSWWAFIRLTVSLLSLSLFLSLVSWFGFDLIGEMAIIFIIASLSRTSPAGELVSLRVVNCC